MNSIQLDTIPRYVPERLLCHEHGEQSVTAIRAFPEGRHDNSPIVNDLMAIECVLACGDSRWFGAKSTWIDSRLRMVVVGFDARDEVRRKWPEVPKS